MANPNPVARFQPGNQHGGRTKGARARLSDKFFTALSADFDERADTVIASVRENDPSTYLNIVARLMPKELEARLQIEQKQPGNLDPESWATLRRVLDIIQATAPDGAPPSLVFETIENALRAEFANPAQAIEHEPAAEMRPIRLDAPTGRAAKPGAPAAVIEHASGRVPPPPY